MAEKLNLLETARKVYQGQQAADRERKSNEILLRKLKEPRQEQIDRGWRYTLSVLQELTAVGFRLHEGQEYRLTLLWPGVSARWHFSLGRYLEEVKSGPRQYLGLTYQAWRLHWCREDACGVGESRTIPLQELEERLIPELGVYLSSAVQAVDKLNQEKATDEQPTN